MRHELEKKKRISQQIIEDIPKLIKREDKRMYLEVLVKNKIYELENDELEYNLRLQEKFNLILVEEIKRLREKCDKKDISLELNDVVEESQPIKYNVKSLTIPKLNTNHSIFIKKQNEDSDMRFISEKKQPIIRYEILPPIADDKFSKRESKSKKYKHLSYKSKNSLK